MLVVICKKKIKGKGERIIKVLNNACIKFICIDQSLRDEFLNNENIRGMLKIVK